MALAYLNDGATSLAAANWSDATGFAAGATLIIEDITSTISGGLDQSGNAIDYLHVRGGAPRFTGLVTVEFDAAASISPALLWDCAGSIRLAIEDTTVDCDSLVINGGQFIWEDGEVGSFVRILSGTVTISAAASFGSSCVVMVEGGSVTIDSTDTIPTLQQTGGTVTCRSPITTINQSGGTLNYDAGTAPTTTNLFGGVYRPAQNAGATVNKHGGRLDVSAIRRATTITTLNNYSPQPVNANSLLTISTNNSFGLDAVVSSFNPLPA